MKLNKQILAALALGASALTLTAQPENASGQFPGPGPNGPQGQPMLPQVIQALDANHDGVVSKKELSAAKKALKALDKNGDGQLSIEELLGKPPIQAGGNNGGQFMQNRHGQEFALADQQQPQGIRPQRIDPMRQPQQPQRIMPQQRINPIHPINQMPGGRGPIFAALDANHDGVIDDVEIANASVALKSLDKNGDRKITQDELENRPPAEPDSASKDK